MNQIPAVIRDQRKIDADHLRILAVCHFVCTGLAVLGIGLLAAHFVLFHTLINDPKLWHTHGQTPPPPAFFALIKIFYVIGGVWFVLSGLLNLISGFCLWARKCRTFSFVVAIINCLHIPIGTILGVFTIIVLMRSSVRELYAEPVDSTQPPI